MSRPTHAGPPTTRAARRGAGRHRLGTAHRRPLQRHPRRARADAVPAPRARPRNSFTRWLFQAPAAGRHTWSFLAGSGGRPRTAFAIILSL